MAIVRNNQPEQGRPVIDTTQNKKITEPVKGRARSVKEQLEYNEQNMDPEFAPTKQLRSRQMPNDVTESKKVSPVNRGPVDLSNVTPIDDVTSILPRKEVEPSPLDNMLARNLEAAVERTKKQISEDQAAIMDKIYEEIQERDMNRTNVNTEDDIPISFSNEEDDDFYKDDDDIDDNLDDYRTYNNSEDYNIWNSNEEDDTINDDIYPEDHREQNEYEDDEETEENNSQHIESNEYENDEEDYGEPMSNDELHNTINESDKSSSTEEDDDRDKNLIEELKTQVKSKVKNTMKAIDLSVFKVSKKPVSASRAMKISGINRSATADWVLLSAKRPITVTGLTGPQIITLNNGNSNKNRLNSFRDMYKILYDGIIDSNKPDFESWLKLTRFSDVPHLYFAYYRATFAGSNFIHYPCPNPKCDKGVFIKDIEFDDMVKFPNDKFKKKFYNIFHQDSTTESQIYHPIRKQISDNYVVDIISPSIWNVIIETASLSDSFLEKYEDLIDTVTYIDAIYLINYNTMELEPIEIKNDPNNQTSNAARKIRVFNDILKTLTSDQFFQLRAVINDLDKDSDQVDYIVPAAVCPYCGATIEEKHMSPDAMLFSRHQLAAFVSLPNT